VHSSGHHTSVSSAKGLPESSVNELSESDRALAMYPVGTSYDIPLSNNVFGHTPSIADELPLHLGPGSGGFSDIRVQCNKFCHNPKAKVARPSTATGHLDG